MSKEELTILLFSIALVILAVGLILVSTAYIKLKRQKKASGDYVDDVKIKKGVRYSVDDAAFADGKENVRLTEKDFVLQRGETYIVERGGELKPGVYTALKTQDAVDEFKIRISGYVRSYRHGDKVILHAGDEIEATSSDVILA